MRLAGSELPGDPECLEIGEGSAAGQVAKMFVPAEHGGDFAHRFDLHARAGAAAIEGVVVGVEPRSHGVGGARDGVGRLEHLPRIKRMKIGIVVAPCGGRFLRAPAPWQLCLRRRAPSYEASRGESLEFGFQAGQGLGQQICKGRKVGGDVGIHEGQQDTWLADL